MKTSKENIKKFKNWLLNNGAEILPTTNNYEAVRFKAKEVGVLYVSGKVNNEYCRKAISAYKSNKKWDGRPIKTGRKQTYKKQKIAIQKRDGSNCFYCNKPLEEDITLEHLISLTSGGKNTLGNMVLAHEDCNQNAGNLTVIQKVNIAIKNRTNEQH